MKIKEVTPLADYVIIDMIIIKPVSKTKSGIELIGTDGKSNADIYFTEHPYQGTVLKVGPGRVNEKGVLIPTVVKEGDHVILRRQPEGSEEMVIIDGKVYAMVGEHMIKAIVKTEDNENK